MNVNLKLLATFLSVAQNGSFRKAAEETHRSLPAVSMQIKQLEEQLGLALFHRTTRKVELTVQGEQLMISARKALAELASGLAEIQQAADVQHGHLSFACVPTIASTRLPAILTAFAKKHPGITVHVRELANQDLLEAVRRREVDFAIGPVPERRGELDFTPIFTDAYCALLPKGYRDGGRASISLKELSKMPLLKLSSSTAFRDHIDAALRANDLTVESSYEFMQVNTLVAMAEAGLGIALLPHVALPQRSALKAVRITGPALSRTIAIITIRGHALSPAAARLVALCSQLIAPAAKAVAG
ncbi:MAG: LysR substrate-binding domain-containing protein [Pseudomonadota bacterium]